MQQPQLFDLIRKDLAQLLNGYIRTSEVTDGLDRFVVPPRLGGRAGVLGALVLAEQASASEVAVLAGKNS
jgi:fructokinase